MCAVGLLESNLSLKGSDTPNVKGCVVTEQVSERRFFF